LNHNGISSAGSRNFRLELVAAGCRNAEIATRLSRSARTVEHHLESILAKLEVGSRTDAVRAAQRLGMLAKDG